MSNEPNQAQPAALEKRRKISRLALPLAFFPSVLLLGGLAFSPPTKPLRVFQSPVFLGILCVVCIACCFTASILMFRRKTVLAVVFGISVFAAERRDFLFLRLRGGLVAGVSMK